MIAVLMRRSTSSSGSSSNSSITSTKIVQNITKLTSVNQTRGISLFKNEKTHEIRHNMTPYEVLGVSSDEFNEKLIKKKYYRLCKEYHPDLHQDAIAENAEFDKKFHMIKDAYLLLKDPLLKRQYDLSGTGWKYNISPQAKGGTGFGEAGSQMMDEASFREYMNASSFEERARYHNNKGSEFGGHNVRFFKNGSLLPGKTLSNWEIFGWAILLLYCARLFFVIGALDYVSTNDGKRNIKDTDWQFLMRLDLLNAYSNHDLAVQDPWNRIRRFLFFRSFENVNRTKRADFEVDSDTNELFYPKEPTSKKEKDIQMDALVKENEACVEHLKKKTKEKEHLQSQGLVEPKAATANLSSENN